LKALGLIEDDTDVKTGDDDGNNEFGTGDDTDDDDDNDYDIEEDDDWWDPSKPYTRCDYIAHFGREVFLLLIGSLFLLDLLVSLKIERSYDSVNAA
jgi:hypothetical protein